MNFFDLGFEMKSPRPFSLRAHGVLVPRLIYMGRFSHLPRIPCPGKWPKILGMLELEGRWVQFMQMVLSLMELVDRRE